MQFDLAAIFQEALNVQNDDFVGLVEEAIAQFREEKGIIENFTVHEKLATLKPVGKALIIGDLHGDIDSLREILVKSSYVQKMANSKNACLIFLGDYGDRGAYSAEVYYTILKLKLAFPNQTILLRGNHEAPEDLLASPHNLPLQFEFKFKEKWKKAYAETRELFNHLYNAVFVEERYLMVHGGLSPRISSIQDLEQAISKCSGENFLEDLLWSDPDDIMRGTHPSPRGAGKLFGENVTQTVLDKLGVKILIRGHEPADEGFKIDHDSMVLTLFSRKGFPYFNKQGAYLEIPLSRKFENAEQLIPWIHRF